MHVLPQLEELEKRFPDVLAVIGVHSPKFTAERELKNLRQAVLGYDIRHPVISDPKHTIWSSYAVSAWPTTVFVDPEGCYIGSHAGEFEAADFAEVITDLADDFGKEGKLNRSPMPVNLERDKEPARTLNFPGKILADKDRLFIADTGHNRILVTDLEGKVNTVIGRGEPGLQDGDFESAAFWFPYGMAADNNLLYVADTWNHSIRRVDLDSRRVERIAGTGEQARVYRRGGTALETALSSPWDLALGDGMLYIAMAGMHQIWSLDLEKGEVEVLVGTGREDLGDGTLQRSALGQPSGLSLADGRLYFADSENSAVRVADIQEDKVETIIGEGLFEFGDKDGVGPAVRLQHCLGVAHHDGLIYVADTYNNKIKRINPETRLCETFLGPDAGLWEPGGVCASGDRLFIADTNNHAIRVADVATKQASTLEVSL